MSNTEFELFQDRGKSMTFSDLMKDIYHNSKRKSRMIEELIKDLKGYISSSGDAAVVVPMIKEYLEVSVKNDDALTKLASIVQRLISGASRGVGGDEGLILSDEEREQLLAAAEEELEAVKKQSKELKDVPENTDDILPS